MFFPCIEFFFSSREMAVMSVSPYTGAVRSKKMSKDEHVKRPLSCFMVYCKCELEKVKAIHPDKKQPEIRTILGISGKH